MHWRVQVRRERTKKVRQLSTVDPRPLVDTDLAMTTEAMTEEPSSIHFPYLRLFQHTAKQNQAWRRPSIDPLNRQG
jgi:hypothetical protein